MDSSSSDFYSGYPGQYCSPEAKRFRHEKWNGMTEGGFAQTSQKPYYGPNVGYQNHYQYGIPYGQQGAGGFSHQSNMRSFGGWSDDAVNQHMMFPISRARAVRQPFKSGYPRGPNRPKSGNRNGNHYTDKFISDLKAGILETLAAGGHMHASELADLLSCHKKDVNHVLYPMQREGLVDKVSETPPRWAIKRQLNAPAAHGADRNSGIELGGSVAATSSSHQMSARSVVPLGVRAGKEQPSSGTSESYDIIPAVAVRDNNVPAVADVHRFAYSSWGLDPPTTALNGKNTVLRVQAANDIQPSSSMSESCDIIPSVAIKHNDIPALADVETFARSGCGLDPPKMAFKAENAMFSSSQNVDHVYQQDVTCAIVSSSSSVGNATDAPMLSSMSAFDIPGHDTLTVSGDTLQTVFGELKRPAGRGRGVLLLSSAKDRLAKVNSASSLLTASCEPKHDEVWLKDERCADNGQFDSGIVPDSMPQLMPTSGANNQIFVDRFTDKETHGVSQLTESELRHHDKILTEGREVLKGPRVDQSSGLFKPPLPPKQLIRTNSAYKAAMDRDVNLRSKDSASLFVRSQSHTDDTESDSYKSLSESLSSLSFRASSLPRTHSFDDLSAAYNMPGHSVECNPFATALGIDDSPSVGLSSLQMPEAASGLSLTSESFAALNKNSVSALMEYGQSRHVDVDIKCIGAFGPPHRPMYVLLYALFKVLVTLFVHFD